MEENLNMCHSNDDDVEYFHFCSNFSFPSNLVFVGLLLMGKLCVVIK